MVELKNIDLSNVSLMQQMEKVKEEFREFEIALLTESKEHTNEEFWDVVQSCIGLVEKMIGITAEDLMNGYPAHLEKIKNRPRIKLKSEAPENWIMQRFTKKE